jgi:hypothetical protein
MVDKFVYNNHRDPIEEIFEWLEAYVSDISHNMNLLMEALERKIRPFGDDGGSNSKNKSKDKSKDQEENESWKESGKEHLSLSGMNPSQSLFNMEAKVDIHPYQGEVDVLKMNHWLQQLEFYFSVHHIDEEHKISFARLKLEGHALTWWERYTKTLRMVGDPPVTIWEEFKTLIKSQFYTIVYL